MEAFKDILKRLRQQAGISQAMLAERAGLSLRTIQNWEIGRNVPRIDMLAALASGLGVDPGELVPRKRRRKSKPAGDGR